MAEKKVQSVKNHLAVVIMAAGQGKRMKNPSLAKVLYEVGGKPMIWHVVNLANNCNSSAVIVIVGHQREAVCGYLQSLNGQVRTAVQDPQLGTGHAVMQAEELLAEHEGDVIVLSGDVPLLSEKTVQTLREVHERTKAVATVLTAKLSDPTGYGRVVRKENGSVEKIVEHKDATEEERAIDEINSGIYVFNAKELFRTLKKLKPQNSQAEYYLTDVFGIFRQEGKIISAVVADDPDEINGVNTVEQLERMNTLFIARTP